MILRSKIKWVALGGLILSILSLVVHLILAKYSTQNLVSYSTFTIISDDIGVSVGGTQVFGYKKLWENLKFLQSLQPYSNPRTSFPEPAVQSNGFIYAKIYGGFEKIRNSIADLVAVSRLLNATLVIPEIQESLRSKGISSKYTCFSYIYNEEQFIAALKSDVIIVKTLPSKLKEARKQKQFPIFKPTRSASPSYYTSEVLPALEKAKVVGLVIADGGCLQDALPRSLLEYQRLRCRVAYHALRFREEILALGHEIVKRLRASGQPYIAYNPGLVRDALAYHGCGELFQDVHTELIQYRREQMIKQRIVREELAVDSHARKLNGSCPLMPEEVGLLLRAMGYPPLTRIYVAGSEIFGGQRVLIPLRAMYTNLVDRTSLCNKQELLNLFGPEKPLAEDSVEPLPSKSPKLFKEEWDKAGPRPRPLPPPPGKPIYRHEKKGWYGWVAEKNVEPDPSPAELRSQAHRLLWAALDYIVSCEADVFFPGFHNDGSGSPDFSSLVFGHRLYEMASLRTYRPNRKYLAELFNSSSDNMYHPKRSWILSVREHLNKSVGEEGLLREFRLSKPTFFLSYPIPECSCRTSNTDELVSSIYEGVDECPKWMEKGLKISSPDSSTVNESLEDDAELDKQFEPEEDNSTQTRPSIEQDEEMDPSD
ncbi:protein EMBRYO SAC DEVELOPMENT ARREST 30-like isoform X2 [Amaranthus tricolor]|uniref:protein EMBRYO SAC DEVELOPMENT ARREST 30-like isoform X2 n=1 Tax=Amaranthus tricolor TaxID=29722 RepID=UPI002584B13E|nr:protein EMBRYO SAC DEVELOPMENT ARREST 30-like isoform X2 [Amaranthus tricolor]